MRLNLYITAISVAAVIFLFAVFALQTERILGDSFDELAQTQVSQLGQLVQAVFSTKKDHLSNFSRVVRSDNDLASSFVLAAESKDFHPVISRLEKLKERSQIPLIDIISRKGKTLTHNLGTFSIRVASNSSEDAQTSIVTSQLGTLLLSYAPLKLYDKVVGVLVLGYPLDQNFTDQLGKETKTKLLFRLGDGEKGTSKAENHIIPIEQVGKDILYAEVAADHTVVRRASLEIRRRMLKFGAITLFLLITMLFTSIDLGFLRQFRKILAQIGSAAASLGEGKLEPMVIKKHRITELSNLASAFNQFSSSIERYDDELRQTTAAVSAAQEKAAVAEVVEQVVHDLKSPLSALDKFVAAEKMLPDTSKFILRGAIGRITDIICDLRKGKETQKQNLLSRTQKFEAIKSQAPQRLSALIEELLTEKQMQYKNIPDLVIESEFGSESAALFSRVEPGLFKRVLSNLVDNAVEATETNGLVLVILSKFQDMIEIRVVDNGKGVPPELLGRLGQRGASFGKVGGSGLGLYSAKACVERWKGALRISSLPNKGTTVRILLPTSSALDTV